MAYITVAYFTFNTLYEQEIKKLEISLKKFGMKCHLLGVPDKGSWVKNCAHKPTFIRQMMNEFSDFDILYVDADAIIQQKPTLFDSFNGDVGVHYKDGIELLSGTIFLKNTGEVQTLIEHWINIQDEGTWDQKVLQEVIRLAKSNEPGPLANLNLQIIDLPPNYTQIFDTMKNAGKPIIEHFQASRRAKHIEVPKLSSDFIRVRTHLDGSLWLSRGHKKTENYLDKMYCRVGNELRWMPKIADTRMPKLEDKYPDKIIYIVGKGPSLDNLTKEMIPEDAIVMALNESIHKVESLNLPNITYVVQQDVGLKETCLPKKAALLLSFRCRGFYSEYPNRYLYHAVNFQLNYSALSVLVGIQISKYMGINKFVFCCFDACVTKDTGYAKAIGYEPTRGGDPKRFIGHRNRILKQCGNHELTWLVPVENMSYQDITDQLEENTKIQLPGKVKELNVSLDGQTYL